MTNTCKIICTYMCLPTSHVKAFLPYRSPSRQDIAPGSNRGGAGNGNGNDTGRRRGGEQQQYQQRNWDGRDSGRGGGGGAGGGMWGGSGSYPNQGQRGYGNGNSNGYDGGGGNGSYNNGNSRYILEHPRVTVYVMYEIFLSPVCIFTVRGHGTPFVRHKKGHAD